MRSTRRMTTAAGVVGALAGAALVLSACASPSAAASADVLSSTRVAEILASPDRTDADRTNDLRRKPYEMLNFIGMRPGMVALDLSAGGGYTSELLARTTGPTGRVYAQAPPRGARPAPAQPEGAATPVAAPTMSASAAAPQAPAGLAVRARRVDNIIVVVQPFEDPVPAERAASGLDLVTLMFNYHDLGFMGVDRARMNRAVFAALKPGGLYVIADHSGRAGTGISESGTLHRVEEVFLRQEVESAGFRLVASGNFLRNPSDPRDRNTPDPPQPKDEFVLKFVKP